MTDDQGNGKPAVPDYEVQFGVPGDWCPNDLSAALAIDERNGMPLVCSDTPILHADPKPYPFTSAEAKEVLDLARRLGADNEGLTTPDQDRINALVLEIAKQHGGGKEEDTANLGPAGWLFIAGVGVFAIGVLMVIAPWKRVIP